MSTASNRKTRNRTSPSCRDDNKLNLLIEESQTSTELEDNSRSQGFGQKKSVQPKSNSKKNALKSEEHSQSLGIIVESKAETQKNKLGVQKSTVEYAEDLSEIKSEKDSWGDTIFNDKEPNPKNLQKASATKRKADKITPESTEGSHVFPVKLSKKTKQTKEPTSELLAENIPNLFKKKFANVLLKRRSSDLIRQMKCIASLDLVLCDVDIPITRQISISTEVTFARLARVIVACMGWRGYHDWKFVINGDEVYTPDTESLDESKILGNEVFVDQYNIQIGQTFEFVYNTNCNWRHLIKITELKELITEKQCERGKVTFNPVLAGGKNACPPDEMSGGAKEYNAMVKVLASKNPKNVYDDYIESYGNDFDPYDFKPKMVNNLLKNFPYDEFFDLAKSDHDSIFRCKLREIYAILTKISPSSGSSWSECGI